MSNIPKERKLIFDIHLSIDGCGGNCNCALMYILLGTRTRHLSNTLTHSTHTHIYSIPTLIGLNRMAYSRALIRLTHWSRRTILLIFSFIQPNVRAVEMPQINDTMRHAIHLTVHKKEWRKKKYIVGCKEATFENVCYDKKSVVSISKFYRFESNSIHHHHHCDLRSVGHTHTHTSTHNAHCAAQPNEDVVARCEDRRVSRLYKVVEANKCIYICNNIIYVRNRMEPDKNRNYVVFARTRSTAQRPSVYTTHNISKCSIRANCKLSGERTNGDSHRSSIVRRKRVEHMFQWDTCVVLLLHTAQCTMCMKQQQQHTQRAANVREL